MNRPTNQDWDLVDKGRPSPTELSSNPSAAYRNASGASTWSVPTAEHAPMFSQDPGGYNHGANYLPTAFAQAPLFYQDPSVLPTQPDPAWLPLISSQHIPTFVESHGPVTTQVDLEDPLTVAQAQASIIPQLVEGTASRIDRMGYQQPLASKHGSGQPIIYPPDHDGVVCQPHPGNHPITTPEQAPIFFQDPGLLATQPSSTCYSTAAVQASAYPQHPYGTRDPASRPAYFYNTSVTTGVPVDPLAPLQSCKIIAPG
ncbi:hypothetical protein ABVK25_002988 [Lepraria finkii]|uniref:Uncharacterized protein n=1 Tax=Lepraria finkii TaxID=1340010 RepID=A0ABR4BFH7_9LECA